MTHFTENKNPTALIYGNRLNGTRKKELPPRDDGIPIRHFTCEITLIADEIKQSKVYEKYQPYGYELHGDNNDKMSGDRAIIEPLKGCKTPGFITDRSPRKGSTHDPIFSVKCIKDCPAVCYFDGWQTQMVFQTRVQSKITLKKS